MKLGIQISIGWGSILSLDAHRFIFPHSVFPSVSFIFSSSSMSVTLISCASCIVLVWSSDRSQALAIPLQRRQDGEEFR